MNFEDYNYDSYNQFILVDPKKYPLKSDESERLSNSADSNHKVGWALPKGVKVKDFDACSSHDENKVLLT